MASFGSWSTHRIATAASRVMIPSAAIVAGVSLVGTLHVGDTGAECLRQRRKSYTSCQAIGEGLRGEIWKAKHENIEILEMDSDPIQLFMTKLRDAETSNKQFVFYTDRLLTYLVESAIAHLPNSEVEVTTPYGCKYEGEELDVEKTCCIRVDHGSEFVVPILERILPGCVTGHFTIVENSMTGVKEITEAELPSDVGDRVCLLLDPIIGRGQSVRTVIKRLLRMGVKEDNIVVVTITMSPEAADRFKEFPDIKVISASIDAGIGGNDYLVPGLGNFAERYSVEE